MQFFIKQHITTFSILVFLAAFAAVQALKPRFMYNDDGSLRQFGIGFHRKTVVPRMAGRDCCRNSLVHDGAVCIHAPNVHVTHPLASSYSVVLYTVAFSSGAFLSRAGGASSSSYAPTSHGDFSMRNTAVMSVIKFSVSK